MSNRRGCEPLRPRGPASRNLHFDLLRPSGFALGDMQFEHTIIELCVYLLGVGIFRQGKTATEAAVSSLNPVMLSVFFLFLKLTLARKDENTIFHSNLNFFFFDLGKLGLDQVLLVILTYINQWCPFGDGD